MVASRLLLGTLIAAPASTVAPAWRCLGARLGEQRRSFRGHPAHGLFLARPSLSLGRGSTRLPGGCGSIRMDAQVPFKITLFGDRKWYADGRQCGSTPRQQPGSLQGDRWEAEGDGDGDVC